MENLWRIHGTPGGDEEGADDEDDEGGLVVQPEHVVVDADGVELDQPLDGAEDVEHGGGGGGFASVLLSQTTVRPPTQGVVK